MKADLLWKTVALGTLLVSAIGCKSGDTSADAKPGDTAGGAKPVEVAFVTNNASDYWTIARAGTEAAKAETPGVTVDFVIPSEGTVADQKGKIDDMVTKGVQGIAMSPIKPDDQTPMINDVSKKVLLFTQDSDAPKSDRACYVGSDNVAGGKMVGEQILKALPNGGKIMLFVGKKDAQNAMDRIQGIEDTLKGSKVQVLDVRTDDTDRGKAVSNVSDAIVKTPDIAGLVGIWSYNGPAILKAVKDANKVGKIKIVCFDEEDDTLAGIKDGSIDATIVQNPYEFGKMSVEIMAKYLRGDKSAIPASKQIFIPTRVIDKTTVDAFAEDLKKKKGK